MVYNPPKRIWPSEAHLQPLSARWGQAVITHLSQIWALRPARRRARIPRHRSRAGAQLPRAPFFTKDASNGAAGGGIPCSSSPAPLSPTFPPSPPMGCAASTDGAGQWRRDGAQGHSEASATGGLAEPKHNGLQDPPPSKAAEHGRRRGRGRKVSPEPKGGEEPAHGQPGSPSFRFYCQKAAKVDALVAAADAEDGASDGSGRATETPHAIIPHSSNGSSESKEARGWLKFRGMAIVAAMYNLFGRHRSAASAPPPAAAKSAASPPASAADAIAVS